MGDGFSSFRALGSGHVPRHAYTLLSPVHRSLLTSAASGDSPEGRREEILTDAQRRIPRVCVAVPTHTSGTPEKLRRAWRWDRRKGTAPKPATGAYSPGSPP